MKNLPVSSGAARAVRRLTGPRAIVFGAAASASAVFLLACGSSATSPGANDPSNPAAPTPSAPGASLALTENYAPLPLESSEPAHLRSQHDGSTIPEPAHDHSKHAPSAVQDRAHDPAAVSEPAKAYVCPMHPEVTSDQPGRCGKCGMKLEPSSPHAEHGE